MVEHIDELWVKDLEVDWLVYWVVLHGYDMRCVLKHTREFESVLFIETEVVHLSYKVFVLTKTKQHLIHRDVQNIVRLHLLSVKLFKILERLQVSYTSLRDTFVVRFEYSLKIENPFDFCFSFNSL